MNISVRKLYIYNEKKELLNNFEFVEGKINYIIGESASGKSGIIECLRYALHISNTHIEKEILGKVLSYTLLELKLKDDKYTFVRKYNNEKTTELIQIVEGWGYTINQILNDEVSSASLNKKQYISFLNRYNYVSDMMYSISDIINARNLFSYSFLRYRDITNTQNLVDFGKIQLYDVPNLNMFAFNIFDEINLNFLNKREYYEKIYTSNKEIINSIKGYIDKYTDKKKTELYSDYAHIILEKDFQDEVLKQLSDRKTELILKLEKLQINQKLLKTYSDNASGLNVNEKVTDYLKMYLYPKKTKLSKLIYADLNSTNLNKQELDSQISKIFSSQKNIEKEIREVKKERDEILEANIYEIENIEMEMDLFKNFLLNNDQKVLDYKPFVNLNSNNEIKSNLKVAEKSLITTINNILETLYCEEKLSKSAYDIKRDKMKVETYSLEDTGSSFIHSCRHIATLLAAHSYTEHMWDLLILDQPMQAYANEINEKQIASFWNAIHSNAIEKQIIVVESDINVRKDNSFYINGLRDQYSHKAHITKEFKEGEKLISDKFLKDLK